MARAGTAAGAGRRPGRRPLTLLLGLTLALVAATPAAAAPQLVKIGDFDTPMYVTSPPGDSQLYVVEKGGTIKRVGGGTFLDISGLVRSEDEERGLLSMAFAPDYKTSGKFYVFYTADDPIGEVRIVEYRRSGNPAQADPNSARPVFTADHDLQYHNGGQLQFGPDGMLYASIGDAQDGNNADSTGNPYGKILRLNPAGGAAAGNPFGNVVWAYGLRNPWRFSFDRVTHDIVIGDVGSDGDLAREEINWGAAPSRARGVDFGWPDAEGFGGSGGTRPILAYDHNDFRAIVGGYVVRDPGLPTLNGRYVFGDNIVQDHIWAADARTGANDGPTTLAITGLTSFGEDTCGHVYAASYNGPVYRIQDGAVSPCASSSGGDTSPPGLAVGLAGVRKLLKKRVLRIGVRCSEACSVAVGTRLRKVRRLATRHRTLAANQRKVVRLKLSKKLTRKLRTRVRRRGFVRIAVTVRATDGAGNVAAKTKRGRIKRR
ncbi:MAG TPA: PQQ-dependent sugar dehydrogenase [Solirubrobacteraceae bacterium]|nr:PQQ-dependent sugar dehydrogenase [Solirubrobacteraceae bacterium]